MPRRRRPPALSSFVRRGRVAHRNNCSVVVVHLWDAARAIVAASNEEEATALGGRRLSWGLGGCLVAEALGRAAGRLLYCSSDSADCGWAFACDKIEMLACCRIEFRVSWAVS